jgi:RNA recognition motif-containing protein
MIPYVLVGLGSLVVGYLLGLLMAKRARGGGWRDSRVVKSPDLYIGNLAPDISGEELQRQFGRFGDVKEVRMVPPRNGEDKCFAFITMGGVEAAQAALNGLNGRDVMGRKLVVSEARSRRGGGRRGPRR